MGSDTLKNSVLIISQNDVSLCVKLNDQMIGKSLWSEGKNDDSFNTNLSYWFESFGSEKFSELHGEPRGKCLFIRLLIGGMESDSIFDEEIGLFLRAGEFN